MERGGAILLPKQLLIIRSDELRRGPWYGTQQDNHYEFIGLIGLPDTYWEVVNAVELVLIEPENLSNDRLGPCYVVHRAPIAGAGMGAVLPA